MPEFGAPVTEGSVQIAGEQENPHPVLEARLPGKDGG